MYSLLSGVRPLLLKSSDQPNIDNWVFRLHYRTTVAALAIQCMGDGREGRGATLITQFCWLESTYSLPQYWQAGSPYPGVGPTYPGLGQASSKDDIPSPLMRQDTQPRVYHAYYQWVPHYLLLLALLFYAPHCIWKALEGGRLALLMAEDTDRGGTVSDRLASEAEGEGRRLEELEELEGKRSVSWRRLEDMSSYLVERLRQGQGRGLAGDTGLLICELANLASGIAAIFLTNRFLGGSFLQYGVEAMGWLAREEHQRTDPLTRVFPKMTKCDFRMFGPSGTIQNIDALCVLGINALNEKIFLLLWFWLLLLCLLSSIQVLVRLALLRPGLRVKLLLAQLRLQGAILSAGLETQVTLLGYRLALSDWQLLATLAHTLPMRQWEGLVHHLGEKIATVEVIQTEQAKLIHFIHKLTNTIHV